MLRPLSQQMRPLLVRHVGVRQLSTTKKETGFALLRSLVREHGLSFGLTYSAAYSATFVPLFAGLELGGVDGLALASDALDYLGLAVDLSWLQTMANRHVINGLIAMECNGLIEAIRLPAVIAMTPKTTAFLKSLRSGVDDGPSPPS